jgi:hypothetical protein
VRDTSVPTGFIGFWRMLARGSFPEIELKGYLDSLAEVR